MDRIDWLDVTREKGSRALVQPVLYSQARPVFARLVNRARLSLYIATYVLTDKKLYAHINRAHRRLPDVKMVVGATSPLRPEWARRAIIGHTTMHLKLIVVDDWLTYVGSHNITKAALGYNHEAGVLIQSRKFAKVYRKVVEGAWNAAV